MPGFGAQNPLENRRRLFHAPTPTEAARFRKIFRRRQTILFAFNALTFLSFVGIVIVCSQVKAVWPGAIWAAGFFVGGGLVLILVWRCPRCGTQFRQYTSRIDECLYCGLQLSGRVPQQPSRPAG